jgi:type I restriction enzyme, S subunit
VITVRWADDDIAFPQVEFRRLFRPLKREVPPDAAMVTAYTDGAVTLRSNRLREGGYHEATDMTGMQGVHKGDFVVHGLDILRGSVGISDSAGAISSVCVLCEPTPQADPRYFAWVIRAQAFSGFPRALARGVREGGADFRRWDTLAELPVPAPPKEVQTAIADYLDTETARIDKLISKKQRMIELLQEGWFSIVESRMRELALEYGTIPLRYLVKCLDGARVPLSSEERGGREGPIPYYGASRIVDWIDSHIFNETLVLLGEDGAQLGDPRYEIAQVVSGKIWVNNHAHVLRPISVDPNFLTLLLNTFDRIQFISGGTREKITQDDMNRIPVPNLSPDEQKMEVQRMGAWRIRCVDTTDRLRRQITLLQERRQALITGAVTGLLDIPEVAA